MGPASPPVKVVGREGGGGLYATSPINQACIVIPSFSSPVFVLWAWSTLEAYACEVAGCQWWWLLG